MLDYTLLYNNGVILNERMNPSKNLAIFRFFFFFDNDFECFIILIIQFIKEDFCIYKIVSFLAVINDL